MTYAIRTAGQTHTIEEMEEALRYLARGIKDQPEGRKLLPIFKVLKARIEAEKAADQDLMDVLELAGS